MTNEPPRRLHTKSDDASLRWSIIQLAAQIAPGIVALSVDAMSGQHTGLTSKGIALQAIGIAREIISGVIDITPGDLASRPVSR